MSEQQPLPPDPGEDSQDVFCPEPAKESQFWHSFWTGAALLAASGGIVFVLSGGLVGRTAGASRSTQLKWEQRTQQIERVEREFQTASAPAEDLEAVGKIETPASHE